MIGQYKVKAIISNLLEVKSFPRFIIVEGIKGQGKHTLCRYIANKMGVECVFFSNKVDSVRNMISLAYTQSDPILYCIEDCQDMSLNARNSLLKICEEPCENAYIVLLTNNDSVISTLKSRAFTLKLSPYTDDDKREYLRSKDVYLDQTTENYVIDISVNMGQIDELLRMGNIKEYVSFVNKVTNSLNKANIGNALKITSSMKVKVDSEGYDPVLFLQSLKHCLYEQSMADKRFMPSNYNKINLINQSLFQLTNKGYNVQSIIDCLIIALRGA